MSTIANLDVNIRVNAGRFMTQVNTVALKFTWLGRIVNKNLAGIAARFGSFGGMLGNAILGMPTEVYFAVEGIRRSITSLIPISRAFMELWRAKDLVQHLAGMKHMIQGLASGLIGLTIAGAEFLSLWTKAGLKYFDEITHEKRLAENLGTSTEFLSALRFKSKADITEIEQLLRGYEHNVTGMTNKNSAVKKAFGDMKLDADDLMKSGLEEGIKKMADAFEELGSDIKRAGVNMELAGRRGIRMRQMLQGGRKGIEDAMKEAVRMGFTVTNDEAREVQRAQYAIQELKMSMEGLGRTAAITIAPFVKIFVAQLKEGMAWIVSMKQSLINFAHTFEFIAKQWDLTMEIMGQEMYLSILRWFKQLLDKMADMMNGILDSFYTAADAVRGMGGMGPMERSHITVHFPALEEQEKHVQGLWDKFDALFAEMLREKHQPKKPETFEKSESERRENKAALRGSLEAYKVLIGAGDKASKQRYTQITWLKKIHEKLEKQQGKQLAPRVRRGHV